MCSGIRSVSSHVAACPPRSVQRKDNREGGKSPVSYFEPGATHRLSARDCGLSAVTRGEPCVR
jgi:hypothetical protein